MPSLNPYLDFYSEKSKQIFPLKGSLLLFVVLLLFTNKSVHNPLNVFFRNFTFYNSTIMSSLNPLHSLKDTFYNFIKEKISRKLYSRQRNFHDWMNLGVSLIQMKTLFCLNGWKEFWAPNILHIQCIPWIFPGRLSRWKRGVQSCKPIEEICLL